MDALQLALIFLILVLSILLAITGFYVFLILKDLKKALDRLNKILDAGEEIAVNLEKPVAAAANVVSALQTGAKMVGKLTASKEKKVKVSSRRFFKKSR